MSELHDSIARTRVLLAAEAERLHLAAFRADSAHNAAFFTRVAVRTEDAADALFAVLNAAHSYLDDKDAEAAMFPNGDGVVTA